MGFCSGWQLTENAGNQNSPGNTKWSMLIQNLDLEPLLVGGLEYEFYDFPYIFGRIIPTDFHSYFSEGLKPPTSFCFHQRSSNIEYLSVYPDVSLWILVWTGRRRSYFIWSHPTERKISEPNLGWVVGQHRRPCGFIVFFVFRDCFIVVMFTWVGWGGAITSLALGGLQMLRWWRVGWSGVGWGNNVTCIA